MPHRLEVPAAPAASAWGFSASRLPWSWLCSLHTARLPLGQTPGRAAAGPGGGCRVTIRGAARRPPTVAAPLTFPQLPVSSRPCPASRARPRLPVPSVCLPFCWQSGQRGTWGQLKRRPEAEAGASKAPGERRWSQPRRGDPKARMACDQRVRGRGCRSLGGGTDPSGLVAFLGSRVCHRICRRGRRGPWAPRALAVRRWPFLSQAWPRRVGGRGRPCPWFLGQTSEIQVSWGLPACPSLLGFQCPLARGLIARLCLHCHGARPCASESRFPFSCEEPSLGQGHPNVTSF